MHGIRVVRASQDRNLPLSVHLEETVGQDLECGKIDTSLAVGVTLVLCSFQKPFRKRASRYLVYASSMFIVVYF